MLGAGDVRVRLSPGVYRGIYSAPPRPTPMNLSTSPAGVAAEPCSSTSSTGDTTHAADTADVAGGLAAARRRFHELREMRREMSGRPMPSTEGDAPSTAVGVAGPGEPAARASFHLAGTPSAASFGLPLDRLAADDPVTQYVLRTAAAERALRQQQRENDELKRTIVAQRGEAALQQALVDRLSADLAESGRTVLRQTATLKSLASEMERHNAHHLLKEKRTGSSGVNNNEAGSAAHTPAPSSEDEAMQLRVSALTEQMEQLTREKSDLAAQLAELSSSVDEKRRGSAVEAIDTDDDDVMDAAGWVPAARVELQQLVQRLGGLLRGGACPTFAGTSRSVAADVVYEVELSGVTCLLPPRPGSSNSGISSGGGGNEAALTSAAVSVCGPYSRDTVLLCVRLAGTGTALSSVPQSCAAAAAAELTSRSWCVVHATQETAGVLCVSLYRDTDAPAAESKGDDNALEVAHSKPSATATIAVRTLIATALSGRRDRDAMQASSTVHTVHLLSDHGTAHGSVTFHVRVAEVHPLRHRLGRSLGQLEEVRRSGEQGNCRPQTAQCEASTRSKASEAAATRRFTMLSPARDDAGTPSPSNRSSRPASRRASAASSPAAEPCGVPPAAAHHSDDAALAVPQRQTSAVEPLPPLRSASPLASAAPPSPLAARKASEEYNSSEARGVAKSAEHRSRGGSVLDEVVTSALALPPLGASVPTPPRAVVPSPPAFFPPPPPAAVVPPPPPAPTEVRVHVRAIRDVGGDDGGVVEGLLEHCSQLQVTAHVGDRCVFTSPARRNPANSVWSAEEGSFIVSVAPGQEIRFEVRDGDAPLSAGVAVVPVTADTADLLEERDLPLTSVRRDVPSGTLSLSFSKPV